LAVLVFHPIAGRWRPACLRVATASVETVSPPARYFNTAAAALPLKVGAEPSVEIRAAAALTTYCS
jgi:hypothetical protein